VALIDDLAPGPVALDTAPLVYLIERHPEYLPILEPLFAAIDSGSIEAVTSGLTLLEVLVVPYRAGDLALAERYEALLTQSRGLRLVELDRPILRLAAHLRATFRTLRAPDALQAAVALSTGCSAFLTNDRRLPRLPGLKVLQVNDYRRPRAR